MKSLISSISWTCVFVVVCVSMFFGIRFPQMIQRGVVVFFATYVSALAAALVIAMVYITSQRRRDRADSFERQP